MSPTVPVALAVGRILIGLLLALAGASASVLARGIKADCGYFGSRLRWRVGPGVVAADVVLAAVLVADLLVTPQRLVLASPASNMVVIVLGIATVFNLLTNWDKFRQPRPA